MSLVVPTEAHCEIACGLLKSGIHVLVEKPISRTLEEADRMIKAAETGGSLLQVGHLERFNPAMVALRPHVKKPVYFEIHRVGEFTARSLDIDVILIDDSISTSLMAGQEVAATGIHAVGIAILTNKVDAANARLEFSSGAVIISQHLGHREDKEDAFLPTSRLRGHRLHNKTGLGSSLSPGAGGIWPGVHIKHLDNRRGTTPRGDHSFLEAARDGLSAAVGVEGRTL